MRWTDNRSGGCIVVLLLAAVTLFAGCARQPWTHPIEGEPKETIKTAFLTSIDERSKCGPGFESELTVTWRSPAQTHSFEAFCQLREPSYLKLAVSSPLGLPLLVIATDGRRYQLLDAVKKTSISGDLGSWAKQHNIPPALIYSSWVELFTGHASATPAQIKEIRWDERKRGAWLKIVREENERFNQEYILFNPESGEITERMIVDEFGKIRGVIAYTRWQQSGECSHPVEISITGLPYNSSAELWFSNIEPAELAPGNFTLAVPASFTKHTRP